MLPVSSHQLSQLLLLSEFHLESIILNETIQFYSIFKHGYKISSYLDLTRNSVNRKDLVGKFV